MQYKKELTLSVSFFLLALLCSMIWLAGRKENLAERISPHILRFHVVANSNSREDQQIKLQVRDLLIEELSRLPDAQAAKTKDALSLFLQKHNLRLKKAADDFLASMGVPYQSRIEITGIHFPAKAYGDILLPSGIYDALQVTLGDARGRNWWCVLYPQLCFTDTVHAIVPDSSKEQLKILLGESDYTLLLDNRHLDLQVRFRLLEMMKNRFSDK